MTETTRTATNKELSSGDLWKSRKPQKWRKPQVPQTTGLEILASLTDTLGGAWNVNLGCLSDACPRHITERYIVQMGCSGVNKSARKRRGRQNLSQKVPSKKGVFGSHRFSKEPEGKRTPKICKFWGKTLWGPLARPALFSGIKMTGFSDLSLLNFVVFAQFLALAAKVWQERPPKKARTDHEPIQNYTFQK